MQILIQARWVLLLAALACGASTILPWIYPASVYWGVSFDWALPAAAALQAAGTFAMSKRLTGARLWLIFGYVSAIFWLVAYLAALAGIAAGAGGLVYGLLIMLPANAAAMLTQILAFVGFLRQRQGAAA